MMLNIIRNNQTSRIDPAVALRVQLRDDDARIAKAQAEFTRLSLSVVDGTASQRDADNLYNALIEAQQRRDRTQRTLQAAHSRAAAQAQQIEYERLDAQLGSCVLLAEKRARVAESVGKLTRDRDAAIKALQQADAALASAIPGHVTTAQRGCLLLEHGDLQAAVRVEDARLQTWGEPEPMKLHAPFEVRYADAVDYFRGLHVEELEKLGRKHAEQTIAP